MLNEYKLTSEECLQKGLNLDDYAITGDVIPALLDFALDIAITRCCFNYDNMESETDIENALNDYPNKVNAFKKLQFRILWNLIFTATDDPVDVYVDTIIAHELNLGKINGIQKGIWYKNY